MRVGVSLRSGYSRVDARLGAQWMVERARAAGAAPGSTACSSATTTTCRCPTTRTSRSSAGCWRSGTTGPRARCSCCRSGIRCCSPSRSGTLASIARTLRHAVRGRRRRRAVPGLRHVVARAGEAIRGRARHRARCAAASRSRSTTGRGRSIGPRSRRYRPNPGGVDRRGVAAGDRPGRPARRRVPHRTRGDAGRGDGARPELPRRVRPPRPGRDPHRGAPRRARRRHRRGSGRRRRPDRRPRLPRLRPVRGRRRRPNGDRAFAELEATGCTDVIVRHLAEDQEPVLRSFEQLATVRNGLR